MKRFQIISVLGDHMVIRFEKSGYYGFRYLKDDTWILSWYETPSYNEMVAIIAQREKKNQIKAA